MTKFLLWLCLLPAGLWRKLGANVEQLRAILQVRLTLDNRRPRQMGFSGAKKKKPRKWGLLGTLVLSFLSGIFYIIPLAAFPQRMMGLTVFYTIFALFLIFLLVTEFSSVLVDTRDKSILFTRPVNDRTLFLARLLHMGTYLLRTVLPMALPGWILMGILEGWRGALWFAPPLLLLLILVLTIVMSLYLLLLRFSKPGRFSQALNSFQIGFSILIFSSYYTLPQMLESGLVKGFDAIKHKGLALLPTAWIAATWRWVGLPASLPYTWLLSALAVIVPLLLLVLLLRVLAPQFLKRMASIDAVVNEGPAIAAPVSSTEETIGEMAQKSRRKAAPKLPLRERLARLLTRSPAGHAGFSLAWMQSGRSRVYRMRVLPTLAYVPVYFVFLLSNGRARLSDTWAALPQSDKFLLLLYISGFVLLQAVSYLTMSDQYKASWIYRTAPTAFPGRILTGAFTAVWAKYFLPYFLAMTLFVFYMWGIEKWFDALLALTNVTAFGVLAVRSGGRALPFSMAEKMKGGGKVVVRIFIGLLIPAVLGLGHYMALSLPWLKVLFFVLSVALLWVVWAGLQETSWADLDALPEEE